MMADWLNIESHGSDYQTVADRLNASPFDELVEIDMANDRCRNVYHVDGKYFLPFMKGKWVELFAYGADHLVYPEDREAYLRLMDPYTLRERLKNSRTKGVLSAELRYRTVDGRWLWVRQVVVSGAENGLREGVVHCYIYDIDVQKQRERGSIAATAAAPAASRRDKLTGLLSDQEFFAQAQQRLPGLEPGRWCVIAVDIENYKLFCDWHGQQVGSLLLSEIGEILQNVERETGGLAGYRGQDDYALLVPYDDKSIDRLFERLRELIASKGDYVGFQPIFGICMVDNVSEQVMDLYNHAALTAEQIKGDFRNRIRIYDPAAYKRNSEEYQIISRFQHALDAGEVFFHLQPQCHLSTGRVVGAEALARWRAKDGEMIPPARFVPVLEKYGMVTNLDKYIWEGVCQWLRGWLDAGRAAVPVSVNVSQMDIFTIDVPDCFGALLEKYRLPANLIKIEITESAYAEDTAVVKETVRRLRAQGFLVLMDDFGSGYSSLNMLRNLNVDVIKLDAQFLRISESDLRKGVSILESIINMAKSMTIPVIVEGVETREQLDFLANIGCSYIQGYYFYRPMPVEAFEELIGDGSSIELRGFEVKTNEQIHAREFMDDNLISDSMLNSILGPVAFYCWKGDEVSITRYNQQFFQMVGIGPKELNRRCAGMQQYLYPEDREKLFQMLDAAAKNRLSGSSGVVRVYKPNNVMCWISLQLYYLDEDEQGMRFYASAKDVTEIQYVNAEIPGGYHRCSTDGDFEFLFVSQGFMDMVGYTADEIRHKFDNKFINMVHHDDLPILRRRTESIRRGELPDNKPYRLKRKQDGYIYVVNQSRMIELDGQVCFQSVAIDVTDMVKLRNQMRLLSKFSSDDVVFVRQKEGGWKYRVVVHGLEDRLGMNAKAFEKQLNSGEIIQSLEAGEARRLAEATRSAVQRKEPFEFEFTLKLPDGKPLKLHMKTDFVSDKTAKVDYICSFREA